MQSDATTDTLSVCCVLSEYLSPLFSVLVIVITVIIIMPFRFDRWNECSIYVFVGQMRATHLRVCVSWTGNRNKCWSLWTLRSTKRSMHVDTLSTVQWTVWTVSDPCNRENRTRKCSMRWMDETVYRYRSLITMFISIEFRCYQFRCAGDCTVGALTHWDKACNWMNQSDGTID